MPRRATAIVGILCGLSPAAWAFEYFEHKQIVCRSLAQVCQESHLPRPAMDLLCTAQCPDTPSKPVNTGSTLTPLACVGLADLTALAGDHVGSPMVLADKSCVELHEMALSLSYYLGLAPTNSSHFMPEGEQSYDLW